MVKLNQVMASTLGILHGTAPDRLMIFMGLLVFSVLFVCVAARWSESSLLIHRWIERLFSHDLWSVFVLSDGLLFEVGHCESLDMLWSEFEVMVGKLGFAEVSLESKCLHKTWHAPEPLNSVYPLRLRYRLGRADETVLEFVASRAVMDPDYFGRVSLLTAKSWVEAVRLWRSLPVSKTPPDLDVAPQP